MSTMPCPTSIPMRPATRTVHVLRRLLGAALALAGLVAAPSGPAAAQAPAPDAAPAAPAPIIATNLVAGGMAFGESRLALGKVEVARGRWAVLGDVTRDAVRERWDASATQTASRGRYVMWAGSIAARRYTGDGGRGFFAEAGGGAARAELEVSGAGATTTHRATVPMAQWGAGARLAMGALPGFVELGYRSAIPLATRHLHAGATPPAGSRDEPVSYQSWYFGRGKPSGQLYAGLGLRL